MPVTVEITNPDGSVTETKTSYSRPNVFRMDIEDDVLNGLAANQAKVRMRIPCRAIIKILLLSGLILTLLGYPRTINFKPF